MPIGEEKTSDRELGLAYAQMAKSGDRASGQTALTLLRKAEALEAATTKDAELHTELGFLEQESGDIHAADREYRAALAADPDDGTARGDMAVLFAETGDYADGGAAVAACLRCRSGAGGCGLQPGARAVPARAEGRCGGDAEAAAALCSGRPAGAGVGRGAGRGRAESVRAQENKFAAPAILFLLTEPHSPYHCISTVIFRIHSGSGVPIYLQIEAQVKQAVAAGALERDEAMPSIRQLAAQLRVNPNTVARAYSNLEREGTIRTVPGGGTFVAGAHDRTGEGGEAAPRASDCDAACGGGEAGGADAGGHGAAGGRCMADAGDAERGRA